MPLTGLQWGLQDPLWQDPINQNTSDVKKIQQKDLFSLKSVFAENINGSYQEVILIEGGKFEVSDLTSSDVRVTL